MPRSLAELARAMPNIQLLPHPVAPDVLRHRLLLSYDALADGVRAERNQILDHPGQRGVVAGRDLQRELREVVVGAAQLEVEHFELAAAFDHPVEDVLQQLGIDEVAFGRDDGGMSGWRSHE